MNYKKRNEINELAEAIRQACELSSPVDLEKAICCLGGELREDDNLDYEAMIEKIGEGFKISIKGDVDERRKRFSIAHELGHLFLHMGYMTNERVWNSTTSYKDSVFFRYGHNVEEYEAHEFAGAFLMPKNEFLTIARRHASGDAFHVDPIADYFNVSVQAAITRGRWLRLFSWD